MKTANEIIKEFMAMRALPVPKRYELADYGKLIRAKTFCEEWQTVTFALEEAKKQRVAKYKRECIVPAYAISAELGAIAEKIAALYERDAAAKLLHIETKLRVLEAELELKYNYGYSYTFHIDAGATEIFGGDAT